MDDAIGALLAELDRVADRARHPALGLDRFTDDSRDDPDLQLSPGQELLARRRRAAVIYAANVVIDDCLNDHLTLDWSEESGLPVADGERGASFVWRYFPPRFRAAYDVAFFGKILVTAVKVGYELARSDGGPPACMAEGLVIYAVCQIAESVIDEAGLGRSWPALTNTLLVDLDVGHLFEAQMDGLESELGAQSEIGTRVAKVSDWFAPFNSAGLVHPFVETAAIGPEEHDLSRRLGDDEGTNRLAGDHAVIDDPASITGLAPVSVIVGLARAAELPAPAGTWVADASAPESSYADLVKLAKVASSGWLVWEPHEYAGTVRTDRVIVFRPHRHFPVGPDQPWAEIAVSRVSMCVPLSAVVSFRPDPQVRQDWEDMYSQWLNPEESAEKE